MIGDDIPGLVDYTIGALPDLLDLDKSVHLGMGDFALGEGDAAVLLWFLTLALLLSPIHCWLPPGKKVTATDRSAYLHFWDLPSRAKQKCQIA